MEKLKLELEKRTEEIVDRKVRSIESRLMAIETSLRPVPVVMAEGVS